MESHFFGKKDLIRQTSQSANTRRNFVNLFARIKPKHFENKQVFLVERQRFFIARQIAQLGAKSERWLNRE